MDEKVVVEILGKDVSASKVLGEVGSKLTSFAKGAGIAIAAGLAIGTAALTKFSVDLVDMGADAGETLNLVQQTFGSAANSYVQSIDKIAGATERSKYQLLEGTAAIGAMSKSMGMGEQAAASYSSQWAQIAADMSSFYNVPIEGALADIQSAMAGSSEPMFKYGIDTRVAALEQVALSHGLIQAGEAMNKQVLAQAVQIAVMEQASDAMGDAERTADSLSNSIKGIQSSTVDASTDLGMLLIPTAERLVNAFKAILPDLQNVVAGVVLTFRNMVEVGIEFVKVLGEAMGINFDQLADNSGAWGANISIQLARGISAATVYVVQALSQLAQVITSLLQPHSPPKILPELDSWGTEAANVWLEGWTEADYGIFDSIAGIVTDALESIGTLTPEFELISRDAIRETIDAVNELGLSGSDALNMLQEKIGFLPPQMAEYVTTLFNAEAAANAVATAQQELNDITQAFSDKLAPLNAELAAIRDQKQAAKDQQKMADLQDIMSNQFVSAADKEAAALELKELQLQQQIKAIEKEEDAAVSAAQKKLDAAKKEEDRIKEMMKLQELNLKMRDDDNKLLLDQTDIIEDLVNAVSGGGGLSDALESIGDLSDVLSVGDPIDFENMFSGLSEQIDAEFAPAMEAIDNFKLSIEGLTDAWEETTLGSAISVYTAALESGLEPQVAFQAALLTMGIPQETIDNFNSFKDSLIELKDNALTWLQEHGQDVVAVFAGFAAGFLALKVGAGIAAIIGGVSAAITIFGGAVGAAGSVLGGIVLLLGGPVTVAIGALIALVGILTAAWVGNWGDIQGKTAAVGAFLKETWANLGVTFEQLGFIVGYVVDQIIEFWDGLGVIWDQLVFIINHGVTLITEWWTGLGVTWRQIGVIIKFVIDAAIKEFENFKFRIDSAISGVKLILEALRGKFDEITGNIRGALQPIIDLINTIKDAISSIELPDFMNGGNKSSNSFTTSYSSYSGNGGYGSAVTNSHNRSLVTNIYNVNVDKNGTFSGGRTSEFEVAMALAGGT